jgi:hypothetical protein
MTYLHEGRQRAVVGEAGKAGSTWEERVRYGSEKVVASDSWLDLMMNFNKERAAMERFEREMENYYRKQEEAFDPGLAEYLKELHISMQAAFYLSEYGSGQFLQV